MTKIAKTILNLLKLKSIKASVEDNDILIVSSKNRKKIISLIESCGFEKLKDDEPDDEEWEDDGTITYVNIHDVKLVVSEAGMGRLSLTFCE